MPLLITDLDNTLYDWVAFFARSFGALVNVLVHDLAIDREKLLDEFKAVHQRHGDSEYPYAALELPSVREKYGGRSADDLKNAIDHAFHAFNSERKRSLKLYDSVEQTLATLSRAGVVVVGHTEAMAVNACFRLKHLRIVNHFTRLYALEGREFDSRPGDATGPDFVRLVPRSERKPNPKLVHDICEREGVDCRHAWYVGDSMTRDIGMAKAAGIVAIWAKYGTEYDRDLWDRLVRITHWTSEDVAREEELRRAFGAVEPDFTIATFSEILPIMGISS